MDYTDEVKNKFDIMTSRIHKADSINIGHDGALINRSKLNAAFERALRSAENYGPSLSQIDSQGVRNIQEFNIDLNTWLQRKADSSLFLIFENAKAKGLSVPFTINSRRLKHTSKVTFSITALPLKQYNSENMIVFLNSVQRITGHKIEFNDLLLKATRFESHFKKIVNSVCPTTNYYINDSATINRLGIPITDDEDCVLICRDCRIVDLVDNEIHRDYKGFQAWVTIKSFIDNALYFGFELGGAASNLASNDKLSNDFLRRLYLMRVYSSQLLAISANNLKIVPELKLLPNLISRIKGFLLRLVHSDKQLSMLVEITDFSANSIVVHTFGTPTSAFSLPGSFEELLKVLRVNRTTETDSENMLGLLTRGVHLDRTNQEIIVPFGFIMPPYASEFSLRNWTSGLGSIIGHELFHVIDSNAQVRIRETKIKRHEVSRSNVFSENDEAKLDGTVDSITYKNRCVDSKASHVENLADLFGLRCSFLVSPNKRSSENMTIFFMNYATMLAISEPDNLIIATLDSEHSPLFIRCDLQLAIMPSYRNWCTLHKVTPVFSSAKLLPFVWEKQWQN